ncbi:MAG TPA: glycosyltransferase family 4 protein [Roseiflexaceae bacterium]|nr:glycosyltransferase family 4 protein [Roseiflexaceae bacterium]
MINATFVMEQHLGHQTYYQNLQQEVDLLSQIQATWVPVIYPQLTPFWERMPQKLQHVRGTLVARAHVRKHIQRAASDIMFFNTQVPAVLCGRLKNRIPYVIATDITPLQYDRMGKHYGHQPDTPGPLQRYKHALNVTTLRGAAHVLPWSRWTRDSLIRDYGVAPDRITVVSPGVDTARWRPAPRNDSHMLRILFVGSDFHRKGGDVLLQAFRMLPKGTAELHIVTSLDIAPEDGVRVYHLLRPNTQELIALYQSADVFVLPAEAEAFGIAAIEAAATGLPSIVTAIGGLPDTVVDGETGFIIPPGDVHVLASRLQHVLHEPQRRRSMGRAARAYAEDHFDARRSASSIVNCLQNAVEHRAEVTYAL